jgi:phage shock protein A
MKGKAAFLTSLVLAAGCTDLQPMQARVDELQRQVNAMQAEIAKSKSTGAAARATGTSASASADAKRALSVSEANTRAIEALNAKIDQMFRKRPST